MNSFYTTSFLDSIFLNSSSWFKTLIITFELSSTPMFTPKFLKSYKVTFLPSMNIFFVSLYVHLLQHLCWLMFFIGLRFGKCSLGISYSLYDSSFDIFGLFRTPFGRPLPRFPSNYSFFIRLAWYSCFYLNFISRLLISSIDLLQKRFMNKWVKFVSFKSSSPIVFFLFLAPFGRPLPLFYWLILFYVYKYSSSEEFDWSYFFLFLLPFGLPRPFWETEICELLTSETLSKKLELLSENSSSYES